jgi:hypothetical protein
MEHAIALALMDPLNLLVYAIRVIQHAQLAREEQLAIVLLVLAVSTLLLESAYKVNFNFYINILFFTFN